MTQICRALSLAVALCIAGPAFSQQAVPFANGVPVAPLGLAD